jgi:hypothetical protein
MFKRLLFSVIVFFQLSLYSQSKKVILDQLGVDESFKKSQSIIPVFDFKENRFETISDFGIKTKKNPSTFAVILPKMQNVLDTSFSFIYFGGATQSKENEGYVFVVLGNNKQRYHTYTLLWIDKNMNLDLNDDGGPDTFFNNNPNYYLDVQLVNPKVENAFYFLRLTRFELHKNVPYKVMLNDHYKKNSGNKTFSGADYSFREQRLNIRSTIVYEQNDSFVLAIKDVNCNGIFGEEEDLILLGNANETEIKENSFEKDDKGFYFERNFEQFRITYIHPNGSYLEYQKIENASLNHALKEGDKLPKTTYYLAGDLKKELKLRKPIFKKKYIYFFNIESPTLEEDTLALGILSRDYPKKIHIIAMNYGDPPRKVFGWSNIHKINFKVGITTTQTKQMLYLEKIPYSIQTNRFNRIKSMNQTPNDILKQIQNKK